MLVLTRKSSESINIGDEITITVVEVKGNSVRLGIQAPGRMRIFRKELYDRIREENVMASNLNNDQVEKIQQVLRAKS
jgi:carbon storage regulator